MPDKVSLDKVTATPEAVKLLDEIIADHGPVLFHQSGGCCDGSSPMCYPAGEFRVGGVDVRLGELSGCPFWMWADQYAFFASSQLIIDVVPGRGAGFSLESPEGVRFITRSRVFTDEEVADLVRMGPLPRGDA